MQSFLTSALLLAVFVSVGVVLIVMIRSRLRQADAAHSSWETTLAEYRNLRDKGVLSADEYRKIRTLVEPRIESDGGLVAEDQAPDIRRCG
jgi:hypothetical protein